MAQSVFSPIAIKALQAPSAINTATSLRSRLITSAQPSHGATRFCVEANGKPAVNSLHRDVDVSRHAALKENQQRTQQLSRRNSTVTAVVKNGTASPARAPNFTTVESVTPPSYEKPQVGENWKNIQGQNDWRGLLEPLNDILRSELIRVGEFAQATYDVFDYDERTRFCGSCRFAKERLLEKANLEDCGYEITDYLYTSAGNGVPRSFFKFLQSDNAGQLNNDEVWSRETNWQGFVAVATDPAEIKRLGRRDILVSWRGTITNMEWMHNLQDLLVPAALDPRRKGQSGSVDLKLEHGFVKLYSTANEYSPYTKVSARAQMLHAIRKLVEKYRGEELSITITGHSLGAALAAISAYDIAETGVNQPYHLPRIPKEVPKWEHMAVKDNPDDVVDWTRDPNLETIPVTVFSFGGPRVGNDAFRDRMEELNVKVLRVVNKKDVVPDVPGFLVNEKTAWMQLLLRPVQEFLERLPWTYIHVGELIEIDSNASPYLRYSTDISDLHNLESYLHVLSGYHGPNKPFESVIPRDLALVNKSSSLLLSKYFIPENWWYQQFKGLVRVKTNGVWVTYPREEQDLPEFYSKQKAIKVQAKAVDRATPSASEA